MAIFKKFTASIAKMMKVLKCNILDCGPLAKRIMKSGSLYCLRRDWSYVSSDFESAIKKYEGKLNEKIK
ncbi:MAG: hypothetical protein ACK5WS_02155 [Alphaproteobacteria bacterium]|jgi:hypothetical protein|nr:hypothetical protein [Candidatus Jidaibacter sp.]